jgi:hypothetical protein
MQNQYDFHSDENYSYGSNSDRINDNGYVAGLVSFTPS